MSPTKFSYPSAAELYALEAMARRERARMQATLIVAAARWIREQFSALFRHDGKAPARKVALHG